MRGSHTLTSHLHLAKFAAADGGVKKRLWNLQQYMGEMQAALAKRKKHSRVEIATKLAQANDLATQGLLQSEIARTLGVSVVTLHRWRKALASDRIAELELENSRLRRLVTDLLLEKVKVQEVIPKSKTRRVKGRDEHSD
jgi:DNA-binding transcriptional regulator YiaG